MYVVSRVLDLQLEEGTLFLQLPTFLSRLPIKLSSTLLMVMTRMHLVLSVCICVAFLARWHSGFERHQVVQEHRQLLLWV